MKFILLTIKLMFLITLVYSQDAFITTWQTTSINENITIGTYGFLVDEYDFSIDWGDGTVEQIKGDDPNPSHIFITPGVYTVKITGFLIVLG